MKKYFLLATTALILGTSNVMAGVVGPADLPKVDMQVSVNVKKAYGVSKNSDIDWGNLYILNDVNYTEETKIAEFAGGSPTLVDNTSIAAHTGGRQGDISATTYLSSNLTFNGASIGEGEVTLDGSCGSLTMKNVGARAGSGGNHYITGDLYATSLKVCDAPATGTLTIGFDYE